MNSSPGLRRRGTVAGAVAHRALVRSSYRARRQWQRQLLVLAQDGGLEVTELLTGLEAELVVQPRANAPIDLSASVCLPER